MHFIYDEFRDRPTDPLICRVKLLMADGEWAQFACAITDPSTDEGKLLLNKGRANLMAMTCEAMSTGLLQGRKIAGLSCKS